MDFPLNYRDWVNIWEKELCGIRKKGYSAEREDRIGRWWPYKEFGWEPCKDSLLLYQEKSFMNNADLTLQSKFEISPLVISCLIYAPLASLFFPICENW